MRHYYLGHVIKHARQTGGKAGKGRNRTSTVQVLKEIGEYDVLVKHFRYVVGDRESELRAFRKAVEHIDKLVGSN